MRTVKKEMTSEGKKAGKGPGAKWSQGGKRIKGVRVAMTCQEVGDSVTSIDVRQSGCNS